MTAEERKEENNKKNRERKQRIKEERENQGNFWFHEFINPWSKEANISQLRRQEYCYKKYQKSKKQNSNNKDKVTLLQSDYTVHNFNEFKNFIELTDFKEFPWLVGSSILTDGKQIKIPLVTLIKRHTTNLSGLDKNKYTGIPILLEDKDKVNIRKVKQGIYHLDSFKKIKKEDINNYNIISIDPGVKEVVSYCTTRGKKVTFESNKNNEYLDQSCKFNLLNNNCKSITNEEYQKMIDNKKTKNYEETRRNINENYKKSMEKYKQDCLSKKNINIEEFKKYLKVYFSFFDCYCKELINSERRNQKFLQHIRTQRGISKLANKILKTENKKGGDENENNRKENKIKNKNIILFGNGTFQGGGYGYATVPKKKLIRNLASKKARVIISDESYTSKVCPFCLQMNTLKDVEIENTNNNNTEKQEKRIRQCTTETNLFCKELSHDRDYLSSINILQKSILNLMNKSEISLKFKV